MFTSSVCLLRSGHGGCWKGEVEHGVLSSVEAGLSCLPLRSASTAREGDALASLQMALRLKEKLNLQLLGKRKMPGLL